MKVTTLSTILLVMIFSLSVPAESDWDVSYEGDVLPDKDGWGFWKDRADAQYKTEDGALYLDTLPDKNVDFYREWNMTSEEGVVVAVRLKVVENTGERRNGLSVGLLFPDGNSQYICFLPDKVGFANLDSYDYIMDADVPPFEMDTTDDFHTYVIVVKGEDLKVYLADRGKQLILDATGKNANGYNTNNAIRFGDTTGSASGAAYWDFVKYKAGTDVPWSSLSVAPSSDKLATSWGSIKNAAKP